MVEHGENEGIKGTGEISFNSPIPLAGG